MSKGKDSSLNLAEMFFELVYKVILLLWSQLVHWKPEVGYNHMLIYG